MTVDELGGRPKSVDIKDREVRKQVEIFGRLCATQQEMADFFDCCLSTIEKYMTQKDEEEVTEFLRVYKKAQANTKVSLRRVQMNKALDGDNTLLIWLGKQLLEQKDKHENTNTNTNTTTSTNTNANVDLSNLTNIQINALGELASKNTDNS